MRSQNARKHMNEAGIQSVRRRALQRHGHTLEDELFRLLARQDECISGLREKVENTEEKIDYLLGRVKQSSFDLKKFIERNDGRLNSALESPKRLAETSPQYHGHPDQAFGHITYAQHGEDMIFVNVFNLLGNRQPSYLDVGAHHPLNISNTALLYERGSSGVNVEANPALMEEFFKRRPRDKNVNVGIALSEGELDFYRIDDFSGRNSFDKQSAIDFIEMMPQFKIDSVIKVRTMTLNAVVDAYCNGIFPDLLTMDIEGFDLAVLKSVDFSKSKPQVICVEVVSGAGSDVGGEMRDVLRKKGFSLYIRTHGNGIFIRDDILPKLG